MEDFNTSVLEFLIERCKGSKSDLIEISKKMTLNDRFDHKLYMKTISAINSFYTYEYTKKKGVFNLFYSKNEKYEKIVENANNRIKIRDKKEFISCCKAFLKYLDIDIKQRPDFDI